MNIVMNGWPSWINQSVSPDIINPFQALHMERYKKIIPALFSDSVKEFIFSKLLNESIDLLEEQVSPDKHRLDFFVC